MTTRRQWIGCLGLVGGGLTFAAAALVSPFFVEQTVIERSTQVESAPAFRPHDCWVRLSDAEAECGTVESPLAPGAPAVARLAVLRIRSRENADRPPLLFLGGGPGHPVIGRLPRSLRRLLELAEQRDLVFVDPRGTGRSTPTLTCPQAGSLRESL